MNPRVPLVLVLLAVVIAAGGGYFLARHGATEAGHSVNALAAASSAEIARLRADNKRLRSEADAANRRTYAAISDDSTTQANLAQSKQPPEAQRLRYLAAAQNSKLAMIRVPIARLDGKLTSTFAELFMLTPTEQQTLQQALDRTHQKIEQLVIANTVAGVEGDAFVVRSKPFDGGGEAYDQLMDTFAQTLGPERNAAFVALQGEDLARPFRGFGGEESTLTVTREQSPSGEPTLSVLDERRGTHSSMVAHPSGMTPDQLAIRYPALAPYVDKFAQLPVQPPTVREGRPTIKP